MNSDNRLSEQFFSAIAEGDTGCLKALLDKNPPLAGAVNEAGLSALMFAAYHRQAGVIDTLRQSGPELDVFEAAAVGDTARLGALLAAEPAAAHKISGDGFTAAHLAAFFAHPDCLGLLLDSGADASAVADNPSRVQPLHSAVAGKSVAAATLLLDAGARVNARQNGGWTPLHAAAHAGNEALLGLLLTHGADRGARADDGATAITLARDAGSIGCQNLLSLAPDSE